VTPRINPFGWTVLAGLTAGAVWFITHPKVASGSGASAWVPARPVRQGIKEVFWKAESDPWRPNAPGFYDVEKTSWVWPDLSHVAVKVWGYR
jgi:hypothetical protein